MVLHFTSKMDDVKRVLLDDCSRHCVKCKINKFYMKIDEVRFYNVESKSQRCGDEDTKKLQRTK